ncbi:hypothetical protein BGZ61DRAFT_86415 [Ilyonectria robusta]|uniref:uncharacterized protein n=1 Tax=Ilyonectria robusta TaxID=1079257 RepID=UPI001E8D78F2|nr:uncharacterized protein BGZ61DRAFT_86415 [Ilyonectria robusta]KAH8735825.1 hypothetical protein BGZ61DRAFT_86415 [Ilyonectria robusta]
MSEQNRVSNFFHCQKQRHFFMVHVSSQYPSCPCSHSSIEKNSLRPGGVVGTEKSRGGRYQWLHNIPPRAPNHSPPSHPGMIPHIPTQHKKQNYVLERQDPCCGCRLDVWLMNKKATRVHRRLLYKGIKRIGVVKRCEKPWVIHASAPCPSNKEHPSIPFGDR